MSLSQDSQRDEGEDEERDQLGELPSTSNSKKFLKTKSRPKLISRVSLVNALKAYTSNEALNFPTFDVEKETTKFGLRKRQKRTFEVDIRNKAIRNLSRAGNVHKKYLVSDIENFQRVVGLNDAVDLTFKNANHAYRLYFMKKQSISSVVMRERFYQLLSLLQCKEAAETEENRDMQEALDLGVESVRVFVTTFNLGGYYPPKNLGDWLPLHDNCDIYVIGVQECNYKPASGESCDSDWLDMLKSYFAPQFVLLGSHSIQHTAAIKISVFLNKKNLFKVKNVAFDAHATGVANMYGNKGAVGCRFYFNETPLTFINVHLAAHEGAAHDRNLNSANILNKLNLGGHPSLDVLPQSAYLFYLGDLNYRVNMEYAEACQTVCDGKSLILAENDELKLERSNGNTLSEMRESKITFPPTYRYNVPRESEELSFSDKKNQTPSYTDRILYHACPDHEVHELEYCSVPTVTTSDHIPVRAMFDVVSHLPFTMKPGGFLGETKRMIKFNYILAKNIQLMSPLFRDGGGEKDERRSTGARNTQQARQNQKKVNLSIKFFWPFGFDGKCKTQVVEASAMASVEDPNGMEEGHSINADWGEEDICRLFPRVMCTEQMGAQPLSFQLIENKVGDQRHIIGSGKISLFEAADHMNTANYDEVVVNAPVVKHGINRGNLVCALTSDVEYY